MTPPGRPREFDEADVLDRGMQLFWSQGFEATGMRQLLDALGISRQSFYNAFGDKHAFFVRVLAHYRARALGHLLTALRQPGLDLDGMQVVLERLARGLARDPQRRSCLLLSSAMERGPRDADVREAAADHLDQVRLALRDVVEREHQAGRVRQLVDVDGAAHQLAAVVFGLHVMAKAGAPEAALLHSVRGAVDALR